MLMVMVMVMVLHHDWVSRKWWSGREIFIQQQRRMDASGMKIYQIFAVRWSFEIEDIYLSIIGGGTFHLLGLFLRRGPFTNPQEITMMKMHLKLIRMIRKIKIIEKIWGTNDDDKKEEKMKVKWRMCQQCDHWTKNFSAFPSNQKLSQSWS